MIEEIFRQTGRTTKTIKEVNDLSLKGRVFFVVPEPMKYHYKRLFGHNANVVVLGDLSQSIKWDTLSLFGINDPVLFDHAVLYRRYGHVIEEYFKSFEFTVINNKFDV
jgi:hypothetical protein